MSLHSEQTVPQILLKNAQTLGNKTAIREKSLGIWQSHTWQEVAAEVQILAGALAAHGFQRGDKLAIVGDNRPRLYWAMAATQSLGGIPVPLYQDSVADEMARVIQDSDARFVFAEDQEQVDKILEFFERCPLLETVFYDDPRGMLHYNQPFLHSYEEVLETGKKFQAENPTFYENEVAQGTGEDIAVMLYTSGTTGQPKGVILTYDSTILTARNAIEFDRLTADEETLAYLAMAWVGDHMISYVMGCVGGFCVNCPENAETVMIDLREIGPTYFFAPPRVFETILSQVMIRMEDASWLSRKIFAYFMKVAKSVGVPILNGEAISALDRVLYALGNLLLYAPLKNTLGLSRIRVAYTGGEAIGPDLFEFFRSLGINIKQIYGQTEASVFICAQPDGQVTSDTVGVPMEGVEMKITDKGEVLYRSPGVFHSYYKNPTATEAAKTNEGWVHTGDAGVMDKQGHLKIIDRAKDIGQLNDGTLFAPKYIENKLKFFAFIQEAVVFGREKDYATALVNIDLEAVGSWAERNRLSYSGYADLAGQKEVYQLVKECIDQVNQDLSQDQALSNSQIKRFLILHKELDADDGELTRTRKVRRRTINERYLELIEALYSEQSHCLFAAEVTFEDGRTGTIEANLQIWEATRMNLQPMKGAA